MFPRMGKEVDMFPTTNKGYLSGDIVIHSIFSSHVETVVLLSKGVVDKDNFRKVKVDFSLEDMDLSEFNGKATYEQIKAALS